MIKHKVYIIFILFFLSACGLSEKEIEEREKNIELLKLNLKFIENNVSESVSLFNSKMALPENRKIFQPIYDKIIKVDSLTIENIDILNQNNKKGYSNYSNVFYKETCDNFFLFIKKTLEDDTLSFIKSIGITFTDIELKYSYETYKDEINRIHHNHLNFLEKTSVLNNHYELDEIYIFTQIYFNLIFLKTLRYIYQKYTLSSILAKEFGNIYINSNTNKYKPNEKFSFNVIPEYRYISNYISLHYIIDQNDTVKIEKFSNVLINDTIWIPTDTVGLHKVKIKNVFRKDIYRELEYNYIVIEGGDK